MGGSCSYLRPRISALLQQIVVRGSDSLYRFDQASCTVDVWTGTVALEECRLTLDSARYEARKASGNLPSLTVGMHLKEIRVSGLKVWTWLLHKRVDCGRLTLVGAEVSLYRHPGPVRSGRTQPRKRPVCPDPGRCRFAWEKSCSATYRYPTTTETAPGPSAGRSSAATCASGTS